MTKKVSSVYLLHVESKTKSVIVIVPVSLIEYFFVKSTDNSVFYQTRTPK